MFGKILLAIDGSDEGKRALTAAISMTKRFRSALHGIYIRKRLGRYLFTIAEVIEEKEEIDVSALLVTEGARD